MRLIDADALLESEIERYGCVPAVCTTTINGEYLDDVLDRQPTIDAEPVRHGKWVSGTNANGDRIYYCSRCGYEPLYENDVDKECKYCQKCGAVMDGE